MKLREHPALLSAWADQPGGAYPRVYVVPIDNRDTLEAVSLQRAVGSDEPLVVLTTKYQGGQHTRDLRVRDDQSARSLVTFLQTQIGKTIEEIGDAQVDF